MQVQKRKRRSEKNNAKIREKKAKEAKKYTQASTPIIDSENEN